MTEQTRPKLSVAMITRNAERHLAEVLQSVEWADEIVIVDSGSTDSTEEIARRHGASFHRHEYRGHGLQRQASYELSSGEWILHIDADEIVTPQLAASIRRAIQTDGPHSGYRVRLHTHFAGSWFGRGSWSREWRRRLFRRERGRFNDRRIHEGSIVDGSIGNLDGVLLHYPYRDVAHLAEKLNTYTTVQAEEIVAEGGRASVLAGLVLGVIRFLRDFLLRGDFLYGRAGLIRSTSTAYFTFLKYAKAWEMHSRPDSPDVNGDDASHRS